MIECRPWRTLWDDDDQEAGWQGAVDLFLLNEGDRTWTAAATALAGIGTAGNEAQDLLLRARTGGSHQELAAWAYWKVGGEPEPALELLSRSITEQRFRHPELRRLAGLGAHAPLAARLGAMTAGAELWTRIEAAHALWAATGDTASTVPVLAAVVQDLAQGTYRPVRRPAVLDLARIGHAAQPATHLLRNVPARDQRLCSNGGWRGLIQDKNIRTATEELLRTSGQSA